MNLSHVGKVLMECVCSNRVIQTKQFWQRSESEIKFLPRIGPQTRMTCCWPHPNKKLWKQPLYTLKRYRWLGKAVWSTERVHVCTTTLVCAKTVVDPGTVLLLDCHKSLFAVDKDCTLALKFHSTNSKRLRRAAVDKAGRDGNRKFVSFDLDLPGHSALIRPLQTGSVHRWCQEERECHERASESHTIPLVPWTPCVCEYFRLDFESI